ncbi:MAG TPA: LuxR C-terminal-related transcriptional regulator [Candidatus Limnocylindria bacterium]
MRRGVLRERTDAHETVYDFAHPLIQEVAYEAIGAARRRELHERLSAALSDAPLAVRAYHAARGALHGDATAIAILRDAAREAERTQAHREALQHLAAARSLLPVETRERREVLDEIGWQADEAGEHATGIDALRELLADAPTADRASLHMRLASLLASGPGDLAGAEAEANEAIRLFEAAGAVGQQASALNELAWIRGEGGDLAAQIEGSREALRRAEALGDETLALHSLGSIGYALASRADADGPDLLRRSVAMAVARGDRAQVAWHTGSLGLALLSTGRIDEATRVLDDLSDAGDVRSAVPLAHRVLLNFLLGRWNLALADHRAIEALHPGTLPAFAGWTATLAGLVETLMGQEAIGARHLEQSARLYARSDFYWHGGLHEWARGVVDALRGDLRSAETRMSRGIERARAMGARPIEIVMVPDLVELRSNAGDMTGAGVAAARADTLAAELATVLASAHALYAHGVFAAAKGRRDAAGTLRQAADLAASVELRPLRARALEQLARLSEGNERVRTMSEAARMYASIGATHYEERARAELRGLGAAGRRSAQTVGALTPREREVVALAKQGFGNKEIAARLDLSQRTIESHLAHIYGKLGVTGRDELPDF